MTPAAQRAYLSLSSVFLAIGAVGVVAGALDGALLLGWFRGNPALTGLFLLVIGGMLRWTALRAELSEERPGGASRPDEAPPSGGEEDTSEHETERSRD